ncbi:MAG: helix-turn-helix transcriptional regulator [Candidatus Heimdallarchaeota archaeon]|nr:helix-turn-helix transcriptional regulator [Candidatus Heimdallarchaeota archaeon]
MNQPDLGKKIAELRKTKGLTQEELVEKCNLSVRTLQRIESGEVTPRSHTIKIIFCALEYDFNDSFEVVQNNNNKTGIVNAKRFNQIYSYIVDSFNKQSILVKRLAMILILILFAILIFFLICDSKIQDKQKVEDTIAGLNLKLINWYNSGEIDSIRTLYLENSCMGEITGRENIIEYYYFIFNAGFRFKEITSKSFVHSDSIVIERGMWKGNLNIYLTGSYLTQWKFSNGAWYIENDMSNTDIINGTIIE